MQMDEEKESVTTGSDEHSETTAPSRGGRVRAGSEIPVRELVAIMIVVALGAASGGGGYYLYVERQKEPRQLQANLPTQITLDDSNTVVARALDRLEETLYESAHDSPANEESPSP
jgi:uncharacterized protein HemX